MSTERDSGSGSSAPAPFEVPYPYSKWLVDRELQCCGHLIEETRARSKTDTTDTPDGHGPHWKECPECGEKNVEYRVTNARRLHEWCDDCENWHACNEPCECERDDGVVVDD